jgi:hypothetical protein
LDINRSSSQSKHYHKAYEQGNDSVHAYYEDSLSAGHSSLLGKNYIPNLAARAICRLTGVRLSNSLKMGCSWVKIKAIEQVNSG